MLCIQAVSGTGHVGFFVLVSLVTRPFPNLDFYAWSTSLLEGLVEKQ
jgi:hypothetical protein